jgi:hypothetical protein
MLNESLRFIAGEVSKYLSFKLGPTTEERLVLANVATVFDNDTGGTTESLTNKAILSLVNVEEDKVAKIHENYYSDVDKVHYKNPPVLLNLYILFSMNRNDYKESLLWLSSVIQFFQFQHVFTHDSHPELDDGIAKLIIELHTLNFEQSNHLWGTLGGKYLPSVMYKVRQLTIDENVATAESGLIKKISVNAREKQQRT